jgi:hypothetical protein
MKNLKNNFKFFATLCILAGFFSSCEKVELIPGGEANILSITPLNEFRGGDDDEDPIIQGLVADSQQSGIASAQVELVKSGKTRAFRTTTTDTDGAFTVQAPAGDYYFRITPSGGSPSNTSVFTLTVDVSMTIEI